MAQSPHAQLREHHSGFEAAGNIHAGVDHACPSVEERNAHPEIVGARRISIGERPRPLVHPELTHAFLPRTALHEITRPAKAQEESEDCETVRIFIFFVDFELLVNFAMMTRLACSLLLAGAALLHLEAQTPGTGTGTVLFEGARLIAGDGRPPIEDSAFLDRGCTHHPGGTRGSVRRPAGVTVVDLQGKTVMPALVDAHSHLGYTDVRTGDTSSTHYTRDNLLDHLRRYAYYGIAATLSMGLDRGDLPYELRAMPADGTALFLTAGRGIAMPNAGPNAQYWRDAAYGVTTEAEARQAVRELAAKKVDIVKIWVDDRNKTVTPLPPSLYRPIIEEAHALRPSRGRPRLLPGRREGAAARRHRRLRTRHPRPRSGRRDHGHSSRRVRRCSSSRTCPTRRRRPRISSG